MLKWILIGSLVLSAVFQAILAKLNDISVKWPLPENVRDVYDEAEYARFVNYRNENKKMGTVKTVVENAITICLLALNCYAVVYQLLPGGVYVKTLLLLVIFELISTVVSIPFAYYGTFVIEEKYGMNKSTKKTFVADQVKEFLTGTVILALLVTIMMVLFENFGNVGILFAIVIVALLIVCVNLFIMKFMRIFNKFTPLEDGELRTGLLSLCEKYGVSVKEISVMDASRRTTRANAFCAGIGAKKDISLDDNLVNRYDTNQIVAVFAHEFGHAKLKHVPRQMGISVGQIAIYVVIMGLILNLPTLFTSFGFASVNYYFVFALFGMISWPLLAVFKLITNYFSRKCEYEADAFAAKEGFGEPLISSLKQLSRDALSNLNPHPVIVALEYSHPTVSQRITAIRSVAGTASLEHSG